MRTCAVCGKVIVGVSACGGLCRKCSKDWDTEEKRPNWLQALIDIQSSFERKKASKEASLEDLVDEELYN